MKKYFILLMLIQVFNANAQVPGYLGKRNSFGYESNIGVAFHNINAKFNCSSLFLYTQGGFQNNVDNEHLKVLALNITHTFIFDRIVKRNASFIASFSFYSSGHKMDAYSTEYYDPNTYISTYTTYLGGNTKIGGYALNIGYRRYRNDLAPLGMYAGYSLGFGSSSAMIHSSNIDSTVFSKTHVLTPKLTYFYGRQNVFFDKLIVDRGMSFDLFGFMLGFLSRNKQERVQNDMLSGNAYGQVTYSEYFNRQLKTRMYHRDMITFYIGCKYMF